MTQRKHDKIFLRSEQKPFEKRTPLLPEQAKILIDAGFLVFIECSENRVFDNKTYEKNKCIMVSSTFDVPRDMIVLGIKELPDTDKPISNIHIYFAHAYKKEIGSDKLLKRFKDGNGILLDLESITDDQGSQLVTKNNSFWAGISGACIALIIWCQKELRFDNYNQLPTYVSNYSEMNDYIHSLLIQLKRLPSILIIGSNGMVGKGCRKFLSNFQIQSTCWTRDNVITNNDCNIASYIMQHDIMLNCIMSDENTPIFLNDVDLIHNTRLSVIGDISCDVNNPTNPLPIYKSTTNFNEPTTAVVSGRGIIDIIAIDNIASFVPFESSIALAHDLFPHLYQLLISGYDLDNTPWNRAKNIFYKHIDAL
jgi:saccharopine dehydrogenase (NAD+, L-lysine forming)